MLKGIAPSSSSGSSPSPRWIASICATIPASRARVSSALSGAAGIQIPAEAISFTTASYVRPLGSATSGKNRNPRGSSCTSGRSAPNCESQARPSIGLASNAAYD